MTGQRLGVPDPEPEAEADPRPEPECRSNSECVAENGAGWECERGFAKSGDGCLAVVVPANAHLRYDGASWECDKPYLKRNGLCVER